MESLTREDARALALSTASKQWRRALEIQDDLTREYEFGWVFFYNTVEYARFGNRGAELFGNAPLIVSRDGRVAWTGTSYDVEEYVAAYRALGADAFANGEAERFLNAREGQKS